MIKVMTDTFIPYNFENKDDCFVWIKQKCHTLTRCIRMLIYKDDAITIAMPVSGEKLFIKGSKEEITWLHRILVRYHMYKV